MIKITFEGTTENVMKEMKEFIDNRTEGVVVEVPKNWTTQDVQPEEPKAEAATAPTMKEYKLEELQAAMQPFINTKLKELQELLAKFQVVSLVDLPKEQYSAFAGELRTLGATI
jgi:hypothetical protein|nr:MAG TPA: hypothetical protein [Caudoviricetes sp.]